MVKEQKINRKHVIDDRHLSDITFWVMLAAGITVFVYKALHSTGIEDESVYYSLVLPFALGQSFFNDMLNNIQTSSMLLYLPMKLFISIVGGTDGLHLFWRLLYIFCTAVTSIVVYYSFREHKYISILAAAVTLFHIPYLLIACISYNNLGLNIGIVLCILLYKTAKQRPGYSGTKRGKFALSGMGVLYGCQVLCLPLTAAIWLIYSISALILFKKRRSSRIPPDNNKDTLFHINSWALLTGGAAIAAAAAVAVTFSKASPAQIYNSLKTVGIEYGIGFNNGLLNKIWQTVLKILSFIFVSHPLPSFSGVIITSAVLADKKRESRKILYLSLSLASAACGVIGLNFVDYEILLLGIAMTGIVSFALTDKKSRNYPLFVIFYGYSALFCVCIALESSAPEYAFMIGTGIGVIGALMSIHDLILSMAKTDRSSKVNAKKRKKASSKELPVKTLAVITAVILACLPVFECINYCSYSYYKVFKKVDPDETNNYKISDGPMKDISVYPEYGELYDQIEADIAWFRDNYSGPIYIDLYNVGWTYAYLGRRTGTGFNISTVKDIQSGLPRMKAYYRLHPDLYPDAFYIEKTSPFFYINIGYKDDSELKPVLDELIKDFDGKLVRESSAGYFIETGDINNFLN